MKRIAVAFLAGLAATITLILLALRWLLRKDQWW